jgi:hypothetical protein
MAAVGVEVVAVGVGGIKKPPDGEAYNVYLNE